jgi:hypothetical protein
MPAPSNLPGISRAMKRPGFWIGRHPHPDKIIMNREEILSLNRYVEKKLALNRTIPDLASTYNGKQFVSAMEKRLLKQGRKKLFFQDGRHADTCFYDSIRQKMNLENVPREISIRYGIVTRYTHQRVLPTRMGLYTDPEPPEFDLLQNSGLDMGTVLAVIHESLDGRWYYIMSPLSSGWVEANHMAFCSLDQLKPFDAPDPFVVVTAAKADIYLDSELTKYHDYVRMGTRLGLVGFEDNLAQVRIPCKKSDGQRLLQSGYIKKNKVNNGFLAYTPRNIITQSFKFLNAPYGWGGMHGEQDCSRFIQAVFSTVGLRLPRNSSDQAKIGLILGAFNKNTEAHEKLIVLNEKARAGTTLLYMKGHIMLYLGQVDLEPYAIHALWGYRTPAEKGNRVRVINSVKVTNLSLGAGSIKGALLERLVSIAAIAGH